MSYSSKKAAAKDSAKIFGWMIRGAGFVIAIPVVILVVSVMWVKKYVKSKRNRKNSRNQARES